MEKIPLCQHQLPNMSTNPCLCCQGNFTSTKQVLLGRDHLLSIVTRLPRIGYLGVNYPQLFFCHKPLEFSTQHGGKQTIEKAKGCLSEMELLPDTHTYRVHNLTQNSEIVQIYSQFITACHMQQLKILKDFLILFLFVHFFFGSNN